MVSPAISIAEDIPVFWCDSMSKHLFDNGCYKFFKLTTSIHVHDTDKDETFITIGEQIQSNETFITIGEQIQSKGSLITND